MPFVYEYYCCRYYHCSLRIIIIIHVIYWIFSSHSSTIYLCYVPRKHSIEHCSPQVIFFFLLEIKQKIGINDRKSWLTMQFHHNLTDTFCVLLIEHFNLVEETTWKRLNNISKDLDRLMANVIYKLCIEICVTMNEIKKCCSDSLSVKELYLYSQIENDCNMLSLNIINDSTTSGITFSMSYTHIHLWYKNKYHFSQIKFAISMHKWQISSFWAIITIS